MENTKDTIDKDNYKQKTTKHNKKKNKTPTTQTIIIRLYESNNENKQQRDYAPTKEQTKHNG